jgi:hypothetical protein
VSVRSNYSIKSVTSRYGLPCPVMALISKRAWRNIRPSKLAPLTRTRLQLFGRPAHFRCWPIPTFRCDAELGRNRGIADIEQAAPMGTRLARCKGRTHTIQKRRLVLARRQVSPVQTSQHTQLTARAMIVTASVIVSAAHLGMKTSPDFLRG